MNDEERERQRFEAWAQLERLFLDEGPHNGYRLYEVGLAFRARQASAAECRELEAALRRTLTMLKRHTSPLPGSELSQVLEQAEAILRKRSEKGGVH